MALVDVVVACCAREVASVFAKALPSGLDLQKLWVRQALTSSTEGLARTGVASAAAEKLLEIIDLARDASVETHLPELYFLVDHRGSDVRIDSGDILDAAAQAVPYPAPIWEWTTVLWCLSGGGVSRCVA